MTRTDVMAESKTVPERLLTIEDVAALCRVSEKTVRRWVKTSTLPAAKLGAQWRIRPRDLEMFIRERVNL
jgi:excisionase family DNA binding protein